MIQLNLLPDVKLEYIKAQRLRRLAFVLSAIITAVSVAILVISLGIDLNQKRVLNNLNKSVASETTTLQKKPYINKILTVQNQLESLTSLHESKPAADDLFNSYLDKLTPVNIEISNLSVDFNIHTIIITGGANNLATVDQYVDTLKFTTFKTADVTTKTNAFSGVVLSGFGINPNPLDANDAVSYTIDANFNPSIFNITQSATLNVPSQITTRSDIEEPGNLFKSATTTAAKTGTGGS
jgi:hypothetical protein